MASDAVADVRDRTDIVNLVSDYVQLRKAGRNFKGLCPFHQEKTPSFIVFPDRATSNASAAVRVATSSPSTRRSNASTFARPSKSSPDEPAWSSNPRPRHHPSGKRTVIKLTELNELAATFYASQLKSGSAGARGREMVAQRQLSTGVVEHSRSASPRRDGMP